MDKGLPDADNSNRPLNPEFVLNQPRYKGSKILLARKNFGCGSSREHAPWALDDYGFRAILAPSFADIFYNNCFKNGLLPIVLNEDIIKNLFKSVEASLGYSLRVDLGRQLITLASGEEIPFDVDQFRKECLINGLDDIGLTLEKSQTIKDFESSWRDQSPWYFNSNP